MTNFYKISSLLFLLILTGCSKDDDLAEEESADDFYAHALVSANKELLKGTWSIFEVAYQENTADIPETYEGCGRDFFQFLNDGTYMEHVITSGYECEKQIQVLNWELEEGILSLTNSVEYSDEMVVVELKAEKLVFKMKIDIDEDGELEVITFIARQYAPPKDQDLYSYTFQPATIENSGDKIKLEWLTYSGFYNFDRYEVYRSKNGCSKANAELIASIDDRSENFFIDDNPPAQDEICYYLKIYNEKDLLGESELVNFQTEYLIPAEVGFSDVNVSEGTIELNWQAYNGNYFSHYEITVRNYVDGTGAGYLEETVMKIEDRETSNFIDENPPYLLNPVYAIYAHDIFGNISTIPSHGQNTWTVDWERAEVLKFDAVHFAVLDENEPELFLFGRKTDGQNYNLIKFNYQTHQVSATANKVPDLSNSIEMQINQTPNGKELFFPQGNSLYVYDASDLGYKYKLVADGSAGFDDFAYLGDDIWVFTDRNTIYTYKRENGNLAFVEQKDHFTDHHGTFNYQIISLKNDQVLVGHDREPKSFKFSIDGNGKISTGEPVDIPIRSQWKKKTLYSPDQDYIVNLAENKLYSTQSFSYKSSFEKPFYPTGISRNGSLILGSNNDPNETPTNESIQEKKAQVYNITTTELNTVETKGYPHVLFEDHSGQIISISSGFKRKDMESTMPKPDLFVEVIR